MQHAMLPESHAARANGACSITTASRHRTAASLRLHRFWRLCIAWYRLTATLYTTPSRGFIPAHRGRETTLGNRADRVRAACGICGNGRHEFSDCDLDLA